MDTSDATAKAGDILRGKTAYVQGMLVEGNILDMTDVEDNVYVNQAKGTVDVLGGYYSHSITRELDSVEQATPTIDVDPRYGVITATVTQDAGYVRYGSKFEIKQLPIQYEATITPGITDKTAVAAKKYTIGEVKVAGDANLVPENIKSGVNIFGVTGTLSAGPYSVTVQNDTASSINLTYISSMDDSTYTSLSIAAGSEETISAFNIIIEHVVSSPGTTVSAEKNKCISKQIATSATRRVYTLYTPTENSATIRLYV